MSAKVFKLNFGNNRVHFGEAAESVGLESGDAYILADTLFSTICNNWVKLYGTESLERLLSEFVKGENIPFLITDCMPYIAPQPPKGGVENSEVNLLFPKPVCILNTEKRNSDQSDSPQKKKLKSIKFLKADQLRSFLDGIFDPEKGIELDKYLAFEEVPQVQVSRTDDPEPFTVKYLQFAQGAGLWFLAKFKDESIYQQFKEVLEFTGKVTGIGGKKSSGAGKFEVNEDEKALNEIEKYVNIWEINPTENNPALCLSICNPKDIEESKIIQTSFYQIINRRGFHYSQDQRWRAFVKKKPVGMILAGSLLMRNIKGRLIDVTPCMEAPQPPKGGVESEAYSILNNTKIYKFRRQHVINKFIVDFYCIELGLVIEIDGNIHKKQEEADIEREEFLKSKGCHIIRFTNEEVLNEIEYVLEFTKSYIEEISPFRGLGGLYPKVQNSANKELYEKLEFKAKEMRHNPTIAEAKMWEILKDGIALQVDQEQAPQPPKGGVENEDEPPHKLYRYGFAFLVEVKR